MKRMLDACGASGPLRFRLDGRGAEGTEDLEFEAPFLLVGRDPRSDLVLPHGQVGDRHAYFQLVGGHLFVFDFGSRAGTFLEGTRLRAGWVRRNQAITIGPYRMALVAGDAEDWPDSLPAPETTLEATLASLNDSELTPLELDVLLRGIRPVQAQTRSRLALIGSAADCSIRLLDPSVANYHAALLRTSAGIWAVDLFGPGGTIVDGETHRATDWREGGELKVGRTTIRLRAGAPSLPIERPNKEPALEAETSSAPAASITIEEASAQSPPSDVVAPEPPRAQAAEDVLPTPVVAEPTEAPVSLTLTTPLATPSADPAPAAEAPNPPVSSPSSNTAQTFFNRKPGRAGCRPITRPSKARASSDGDHTATNGHPTTRPSPPHAPVPEVASRPSKRTESARPSAPPVPPPSRGRAPERPKSGRIYQNSSEPEPQAPNGIDRRGSCRYRVTDAHAQLAWWQTGPSLGDDSGPAQASTLPASSGMPRGTGLYHSSPGAGGRPEPASSPRASLESPRSCVSRIQLVDISQTGLSALGGQVPPKGERTWVRLDNGEASDWAEVILVGHKPSGPGTHLIRFSFRESCPYDMFKALIMDNKSARSP